MLNNVNNEFWVSEISIFRQYSRIPDDRTDDWKYASFERVETARKAWFYRLFGTKKAFARNAVFRNSRAEKGSFLVQNVKNQFLHQLSWRGIGVVQTLTFSIYLAYLTDDLHHLACCVVSHARHVVLRSPW